jgi:hypothetical protein
MDKFDITNLFPNFSSRNLSKKELEQIIKEAITREHPMRSIKEIQYNKDGVEITLDGGEIIEVEIDWQEFVLR